MLLRNTIRLRRIQKPLPLDCIGNILLFLEDPNTVLTFLYLDSMTRDYIFNENPSCLENVIFTLKDPIKAQESIKPYVIHIKIRVSSLCLENESRGYLKENNVQFNTHLGIIRCAHAMKGEHFDFSVFPNLKKLEGDCEKRIVLEEFWSLKKLKNLKFVKLHNSTIMKGLKTLMNVTEKLWFENIMFLDDSFLGDLACKEICFKNCNNVTNVMLKKLPKNLQKLQIFSEEISNEGLSSLENLKELEIKSKGSITDSSLKKLKHLEKLVLHNCSNIRIQGEGINSKKLKFLKVLESFKAQFIREEFSRNIKVFYKRGFDDLDSSNVSVWPNLEELSIRDCMELTDRGLCHLGRLKGLKKFYLNNCPLITDIGLTYFGKGFNGSVKLENLKVLFCKGIKGDGLGESHYYLKKLSLRCKGFTYENLKKIIQNCLFIKELKVIDACFGFMNFKIFENLQYLKTLYLHNLTPVYFSTSIVDFEKPRELRWFFCSKNLLCSSSILSNKGVKVKCFFPENKKPFCSRRNNVPNWSL